MEASWETVGGNSWNGKVQEAAEKTTARREKPVVGL